MHLGVIHFKTKQNKHFWLKSDQMAQRLKVLSIKFTGHEDELVPLCNTGSNPGSTKSFSLRLAAYGSSKIGVYPDFQRVANPC